MINKKAKRIRRSKRTRYKIAELNVIRLSVTRSAKHISAQLFSPESLVLASASSMELEIRSQVKTVKGKVGVAELVGQLVAKRAVTKGVTKIAFNRSGYRFHGRVKALADGARAGGLEF